MKIDFDYKIDFSELKEIENRSFKITPDSALIIVDMNNGFAKEGALFSHRVENIIPDVCEVAEHFYSNNLPIIAFTDCHAEGSAEFNYYPVHCMKNSLETQLIDELHDFMDKMIIIEKNSTNGFLEDKAQTAIKRLLSEGYKNWMIIGCCTDICIKSLSITLKNYFNKENLRYNVIVPISAVDTYDAPAHNANAMNLFSLSEMKANGIELVDKIY